VKVPVVVPAGTVTVAGTEIWPIELERLTEKSPDTGEARVTVPVEVVPAVTVLGVRETLTSEA
jgi:hypothetical protein